MHFSTPFTGVENGTLLKTVQAQETRCVHVRVEFRLTLMKQVMHAVIALQVNSGPLNTLSLLGFTRKKSHTSSTR